MEFNWDYALLVLGALVPFFTAFVKRKGTPDWQSGLITVVGSAIAATGQGIAEVGAGDLTWDMLAGDTVQVWGVALATWLGLTSDATDRVLAATKGFIGRVPAEGPTIDYDAIRTGAAPGDE